MTVSNMFTPDELDSFLQPESKSKKKFSLQDSKISSIQTKLSQKDLLETTLPNSEAKPSAPSDSQDSTSQVLSMGKERADKIVVEAKQKTQDILSSAQLDFESKDESDLPDDKASPQIASMQIASMRILLSDIHAYVQDLASKEQSIPHVDLDNIKSLAQSVGESYSNLEEGLSGETQTQKISSFMEFLVDYYNSDSTTDEQRLDFISANETALENLNKRLFVSSDDSSGASVFVTDDLFGEDQDTSDGGDLKQDPDSKSAEGAHLGAEQNPQDENMGDEPSFTEPKKTRRFKKFIVGALIAGAVAIGSYFAYNATTSDSDQKSAKPSQKIESVSTSLDSGEYSHILGTDSISSEVLDSSNASGFPTKFTQSISSKHDSSSQIMGGTTTNAQKTFEETKPTQTQTTASRFEIVGDTYFFNMSHPQNAKLAKELGISGFVKYAMQDSGSFEGINDDFMGIVDINCQANLGVSLADCDMWQTNDLKLENTVVISLEKSKPLDITPKQPTPQPKPQDCDDMLELLGVDSNEVKDVHFEDDGYFHIKYEMVDSLHYLQDSAFMKTLLDDCFLVVDEKQSAGLGPSVAFPVEDSTHIHFSPDTSHEPLPYYDSADTVKSSTTIYQIQTDDGKDRSSGILKHSTRHKR